MRTHACSPVRSARTAPARFARTPTFMYNICLCICMSSRNIAVQKAVYDALNREKRGGESFTSVLRRLLEQREGLGELAGAWGRSGDRKSRASLRSLRAAGRRLAT